MPKRPVATRYLPGNGPGQVAQLGMPRPPNGKVGKGTKLALSWETWREPLAHGLSQRCSPIPPVRGELPGPELI